MQQAKTPKISIDKEVKKVKLAYHKVLLLVHCSFPYMIHLC